ncbi:site-specific integrase [Streptomyces sp. NPDC005526]|uniref:tyrosine-type recombinase/integrase n=1 Tax=Streptomyces sp. NPDC005526 TaxID=3156885 RepID=UPI0033A05ACF
MDDELIRRNPCRIKGADRYDVPERPVLTVAEVFALADSIAPRYRLLVLLAAFTTLRFGELAALRRRDIDPEALTVTVRRAQAELQDGRLFDKAPKSAAGVRSVSFPAELLDEVKHHLEHFAAPGRDGHVFVGPQGGQLRRSNFRDDWVKARKAAGATAELHFHDLRHTGNTLASTAGASTRELMTRMGHSSSRAALIYQHMTSDRDRAIADRLGAVIRGGGGSGLRVLRRGRRADVVARVWHGAWNDEGPAWEEIPPELALLSVPPAAFEPATPALGVHSRRCRSSCKAPPMAEPSPLTAALVPRRTSLVPSAGAVKAYALMGNSRVHWRASTGSPGHWIRDAERLRIHPLRVAVGHGRLLWSLYFSAVPQPALQRRTEAARTVSVPVSCVTSITEWGS